MIVDTTAGTLSLDGLQTEPLASYLSALAVLRLLGEGPDPGVAGKWKHGTFVLSTVLTAQQVLDYFLHEYSPTPMVSPWNAASGFYKNDNKAGIKAILASTGPRFQPYRETIQRVQSHLTDQGISERPSGHDKVELFKDLRSILSDHALKWLDAVLVLGTPDAKGRVRPNYAPLLGSGGNDARLEFSNNFMQRLHELFLCDKFEPEESTQLLRSALYGEVGRPLQRDHPVGQFDPGASGGVNSTVGFGAQSLVNPWTYVLMLEGSLLLAAGAARRLGGTSRAGYAFPFTVSHLGVAHGKLASDEGHRQELWLPIWEDEFVGLGELEQLFAQGRAQVGSQQARSPVEFSLAVTSGGISRGLTGFTRFGFLQRNGESYFATPLGYYPVRDREGAYELRLLERWFGRHRWTLYSHSQASRSHAVRYDSAVMEYLKTGQPSAFTAVLERLGELNYFLAGRPTLQGEVPPIRRLRESWVPLALENSPEFRLALSLSTLGGELPDPRMQIRGQLEPCGPRGLNWKEGWKANWRGRDLSERMLNLLLYRLHRAASIHPMYKRQRLLKFRDSLWSLNPARLSDVQLFLEGGVDEARIERLLYGLILVKPAAHGLPARRGQPFLGHHYCLAKLAMSQGFPLEAYAPRYAGSGSGYEPPREGLRDRRPQPQRLPRLLATGKLREALHLARQHLLARPLVVPDVGALDLPLPPDQGRRLAAAMLFPISDFDYLGLAQAVLNLDPQDSETETHS